MSEETNSLPGSQPLPTPAQPLPDAAPVPAPQGQQPAQGQQQPPPPFACTYSNQVVDILDKGNCSVLLSTYQAGKVIVLTGKGDRLTQLPRTFRTPMGLALSGSTLAVACRDEVVILNEAPELAANYPRQKDVYDTIYLPRASYYTGPCDMHDLAWGNEGLICVNTRFSCLCKLSHTHSFEPIWSPPFVKSFAPEDHCHLNGLAMENGVPRYVTALGPTDAPKAWRPYKENGGLLIDVQSNKIVRNDLAMPHSPRIFDGELFVLNSVKGEVLRLNRDTYESEVIAKIPAWLRGLAKYGDYLFVGLSKLRRGHTFQDVDLAKQPLLSGLAVIHLPSKAVVGTVSYQMSCDEIYDVAVIPGRKRPGLLGLERDIFRMSLYTSKGSWWVTPPKQEQPPQGRQPQAGAVAGQVPPGQPVQVPPQQQA